MFKKIDYNFAYLKNDNPKWDIEKIHRYLAGGDDEMTIGQVLTSIETDQALEFLYIVDKKLYEIYSYDKYERVEDYEKPVENISKLVNDNGLNKEWTTFQKAVDIMEKEFNEKYTKDS